jgi:predicted RNA-binding protein with PIN domain
MRYLIDGYNLLHAMGAIRGTLGPTGLENARARLLGVLKGSYGEDAGQISVIFDGSGALAGTPAETVYQGIHVRYAIGGTEADDLIEELIEHEGAPTRLTVVSDDHRIQRAARRRRCCVVGCLDYLEDLIRERRRRHRPSATSDEKSLRGKAEDIEYWLQEFGELETDPELARFFEMDRFNRGVNETNSAEP